MPTREEVEAARARLGLAPARPDQQQQRGQVGFQKPPTEPVPLPVKEKPTRGGFSGFVKRLVTPIVDVPDLPGGPLGEVVEQGVESLTSPVGIASALLVPVTGGASLGLRGAAGVGAKVGTRLAAEAAAGGAAGLAAEQTAKKLEGAPGAVRLLGSLGAGALAGGGVTAAANRALKSGSTAAKAAIATPEVDSAVNVMKTIDDQAVAARLKLSELGKRQEELYREARAVDKGMFQSVVGLGDGRGASKTIDQIPTTHPIRPLLDEYLSVNNESKIMASEILRLDNARAEAFAAASAGGAVQSVGGYTPAANFVITQLTKAKAKLRDPAFRKELEASMSAQREQRLAAAEKAARGLSGQAYYRAAQGAMKDLGEYSKVAFPELQVPSSVLDELTDEITKSKKLIDILPDGSFSFEKNNAANALFNALVKQQAPTPYEAELLEKVFGPAFARAIQPDPSVVGRIANTIINLPRAALATFDISWPLNQGVMLATSNRKGWVESWKVAGRSMLDPEYAKEIDLLARGQAGTAVDKAVAAAAARGGLHITGGTTATEGFEVFDKGLGKFLEKSLAGQIAAGSERAYTAPANFLRINTMKKALIRMAPAYAKAGDDMAAAIGRVPYLETKRLADTVNVLTGRSPLLMGKVGHKYGPAMNFLMFAPHYVTSRFQALLLPAQSLKLAVEKNGLKALADPVALWKSDPILQLQAKSLGGFVAEGMGILAAAKLASEAGLLDATVETDPRSRRFGKVQINGRDFDFWGGYSQIASTVAQMVTGEQKSRIGGIRPVGAPDDSRLEKTVDVFWDKFARSKTAPWPGMAWDVLTGKTYTGERLSGDPDHIDEAIKERLLPLAVQDVIDGYRESGWTGAAKGASAFVGLRQTSFLTLGDVKNDVAEEKFGKPYSELDRGQRENVDNHSRVLDKAREYDLQYGDSFESARNQILFERAQNENVAFSRYLTRADTPDQFAKRLEDANLRARTKIDQEAERLGIVGSNKTSLLDQGYQQFIELYDLADIGYEKGVRNGDIDWEKFNDLKESLYARLTPEQRQFIDEKAAVPHDKSVQWYYNNKDYIKNSGYNAIVADEFERSAAAKQFGSYGELLAAEAAAKMVGDRSYNRIHQQVAQIQKRATLKKEAMRRKDPNLDAALIANGVTSKPLTAAAKRLVQAQ